MQIPKVAVMIASLFTANAQAADNTSPVIGQFPQTEHDMQVYLFMLKKNDISLDMTPEEFCRTFDYGEAVKGDRSPQIKSNSIVPGPLNWVICRFKNYGK